MKSLSILQNVKSISYVFRKCLSSDGKQSLDQFSPKITEALNSRSISYFSFLRQNHKLEPEPVKDKGDAEQKEGDQKDVIMKVLNVAEKNDAAKRIANLLSGGTAQTRNGYSVYNKLYEFQYNFQNQQCQMVMTSVSGHMLNYEFDQRYRKWYSCDPVELFEAPVLKQCQDNMKEIKRTLEQQAAYCQVLIIWTDCDREGENIGYEVINTCTGINPRLRIFRAKFSEITKHAVQTAMNRLIQPDKRVSDAVDVRQELDLRIGAAFTRFQTLRLTRKFPAALTDRLISYGSCQFPTLGFVVERYKSILDFIQEDFWKIDVTHKVDDMTVHFGWARVRLFERLAVQTIHEACLDDPTARVVKVQSKPKNKWRPVALDTIEFEKLASRKLRIGAKEAMQIAEQLYTSGFISYPRTETNIFPPSLDLGELVAQQRASDRWGDFATRLAQTGPNPRNGKKTDQAHPPIHPTKFDNLNNLSDKHKRVYELIVRHFLACCSKDALGKETIVEIEIAGEKFIASGLIVLERNYLEVYIYDKWSDKEIPNFTDGEEFIPTRIEMNEGKTSPPNLLTEADLIALMEKHGIGTDATHAEHIETIKQRQYVGLQGIHFIPGKLGMGLVEGYDAMGFQMSKPHLRAQFEADLQAICQGTKNPQVVLTNQIREYKQVFIQASDQVVRLDEAIARLLNDNPNAGGGVGGGGGGGGDGFGGGGGGRGGGRGRGNPGGSARGGRGGGGRGNNPRRRDDDSDDDNDDFGGGGGAVVSNNNRSNTAAPDSGNRYSANQTRTASSFSGQSHSVPVQRPAYNQNENVQAPDDVQCLCGTVPVIRTTRKEGPNFGRQFYKCDTCSFFQWLDAAAGQSSSSGPTSALGFGTQSYSNTGSSASGSGSSYSRSAMGPPAAPTSRFKPPPPSNQNVSNYQRNQPTQSHSSSFGPDSENVNAIPNCGCNKPANQYTVRKEGANKGRKFFGCSIPFGTEQRCDFFQWDDAGIGNAISDVRTTPKKGGTGAYSGIGNLKTSAVGRGGGVKRARRCGLCHQEGHTRRNCPLAGGEEDEDVDY